MQIEWHAVPRRRPEKLSDKVTFEQKPEGTENDSYTWGVGAGRGGGWRIPRSGEPSP